MIIIASFPRSGNHLVRFFVEYMSGRSTLGCASNPDDHPLCADTYSDPAVLAHVGPDPVAHKAHWREEVEDIYNRYPVSGIVLIERAPVEAILAHVTRRRRDFLGLIYRRDLRDATNAYFGLSDWISHFPGARVTLAYDDLISDDPATFAKQIRLLQGIFGTEFEPSLVASAIADFQRLRSICSKPTRRAWHGFRSVGKSDYHRSRSAPWAVRYVERLVKDATG
jgi:hypothetical protein